MKVLNCIIFVITLLFFHCSRLVDRTFSFSLLKLITYIVTFDTFNIHAKLRIKNECFGALMSSIKIVHAILLYFFQTVRGITFINLAFIIHFGTKSYSV